MTVGHDWPCATGSRLLVTSLRPHVLFHVDFTACVQGAAACVAWDLWMAGAGVG